MPIIIGDPAYIDIVDWSEQRRLREAVIITREKENSVNEAKVQSHTAARRAETPITQRVPSRERVRHAFQLTCQFIRLVCYCLDHRVRWIEALPLFQHFAPRPLVYVNRGAR